MKSIRFALIEDDNIRVVATRDGGCGPWLFTPEKEDYDAMGQPTWRWTQWDETVIQRVMDAVLRGKSKTYDEWQNELPQLEMQLEYVKEVIKDTEDVRDKWLSNNNEVEATKSQKLIDSFFVQKQILEKKVDELKGLKNEG